MPDPDPTETEVAERAFAKAVFAPDEPDEPEPDEQQTPTGNYVPREGTNPQTKDDSDLAFVRNLFDNN